jgi:hypothetical protein
MPWVLLRYILTKSWARTRKASALSTNPSVLRSSSEYNSADRASPVTEASRSAALTGAVWVSSGTDTCRIREPPFCTSDN